MFYLASFLYISAYFFLIFFFIVLPEEYLQQYYLTNVNNFQN